MTVTTNRKARSPLAVYRYLAGLSQNDLAELAGVRPATICDLETRRHRPRRSTARALAEALGTEPPALFPELDWPDEEVGE